MNLIKLLKCGEYRSSHWRCSVAKGVFRNFAKFTGKHLCHSLFFNKVAGAYFSFTLVTYLFSSVFLQLQRKIIILYCEENVH